jgi:hypothetical protein
MEWLLFLVPLIITGVLAAVGEVFAVHTRAHLGRAAHVLGALMPASPYLAFLLLWVSSQASRNGAAVHGEWDALVVGGVLLGLCFGLVCGIFCQFRAHQRILADKARVAPVTAA